MRYSKKIDANQTAIVKALRAIPGVSVALDHDDILIGYKGNTYWYECKISPKSEVKKSQYKLAKEWTGHYKFAFTVDDILQDIGIQKISPERALFNAVWLGVIRMQISSSRANKAAIEATERYRRNEFESPSLLIEEMIQDADK